MRIAHSALQDVTAVAESLKAQVNGLSPEFVLFFASSQYDPNALGKALGNAFGPVPSLGCTTAGELVSGRMLKNSVVLMAMDAGTVARAATAPVVTPGCEETVATALNNVSGAYGKTAGSLDRACHLGLVLQDGLGMTEESVMSTLTSRTNAPFVGGSAGDDLAFQATHVFVDFAPRRDSCGLAMLELCRPYSVLKTQSFEVLDSVLEVTAVDEPTRRVHTLNHRPAAAEYARAVGVEPHELPGRFRQHPLGVLVSETEPFVRSPQLVDGDDVVFFCQVKKGMQLRLLRARDIVEDTRRDLARAFSELGSIESLINFHCIFRTLELEERGQCEAYSELFRDVPTIGFSTYGESYIGHINQSSTMVLLT
ncbi:FIST signal transduction protein [Myxococcota bacterium]